MRAAVVNLIVWVSILIAIAVMGAISIGLVMSSRTGPFREAAITPAGPQQQHQDQRDMTGLDMTRPDQT